MSETQDKRRAPRRSGKKPEPAADVKPATPVPGLPSTQEEVDALLAKAYALGREDTYDAAVHIDAMLVLMAQGRSETQVSKAFGVSKNRFREWLSAHTELGQAYHFGVTLAEAYWEEQGQLAALGVLKTNPAVWIFTMKNRFGWTEKTEETLKGQMEVKQLDDGELDKKLNALLAKATKGDGGGG